MLIQLREEIEQRRVELGKRFQCVFAIVILDREGNLLDASQERDMLLGYVNEDLSSINMFTHSHPNDKMELWEMVQQVIATQIPGRCDFYAQHITGRWIAMRAYGFPRFGESGEVSGCVFAYHELVDLKDYEEKQNLERILRKTINKQKRTG